MLMLISEGKNNFEKFLRNSCLRKKIKKLFLIFNKGGYQYSFKIASLSISILHCDPVGSGMKNYAQTHFEKMRNLHAAGLINRSMKSLATEIHEIHELDRLSLFAFPLSGSVHQNAPTGYQRDAVQLTAQMGQIWLWEHLFKVLKIYNMCKFHCLATFFWSEPEVTKKNSFITICR